MEDDDFKKIWASCVHKQPYDEFYIHDDFLMKSGKLYLSHTSLHKKVIRVLHGGGLVRHLLEGIKPLKP